MKKTFMISIVVLGLIAIINAQGITNTLGGNTSSDKFIVENSDSEVGLVVTGEGKAGIGTTAPQGGLHVSGDGGNGTALFERSGKILALNPNYGGYNNFAHITTIIGSNMGLKFDVNDQNGLTITTATNVGIGTTSPASKLSVGGSGDSYATIYGIATLSNRQAVYGEALGGGVNSTGVYGNNEGGNNGVGVKGRASGDEGIGVYGFATGVNSIGVYAWGSLYDFNAYGPGVNYGTGSSIRWKTNIIEIDKPLEKIAGLRGVYFNWDEEHGGQHDIGCIAEEVGKVLPEIVVYEENGIDADGMDYSKLTPLLVEAVKALTKRVEDLENR